MQEDRVASLFQTNIIAKTIQNSHFQPIDGHFFRNNQVDKMSQKSNKKEDSDKRSGDNKKVPPAPVPVPKKEAPVPARPPPSTQAPSKEAPARPPIPATLSSKEAQVPFPSKEPPAPVRPSTPVTLPSKEPPAPVRPPTPAPLTPPAPSAEAPASDKEAAPSGKESPSTPNSEPPVPISAGESAENPPDDNPPDEIPDPGIPDSEEEEENEDDAKIEANEDNTGAEEETKLAKATNKKKDAVPKANRPAQRKRISNRPLLRPDSAPRRPAAPPPDENAPTLNALAICLIVAIVGLLLMIITGGIVYAVYDYQGKAFGLFTPVKVTTPEPVYYPPPGLSFRPPGYIPLYPPDPSEPCPSVPTCPKCTPVQNCQKAPRQQGCIFIQKPTMCPAAGTCPTGQCRQCSTIPPIATFNNGDKKSRTVFEWLNMYPPFSVNRLHVLTHLLDETVEKWALGGFMHRCTPHSSFDRDTTKCTMCNDRYNYIKCVMTNTLSDSLYEPVENNNFNKPYYHPNDADFHGARYEVPKTVYQDNLPPAQLEYIFKHMEKAIRPFQVKTQNGKECRICTDYNRQMYNKCFLEGFAYIDKSK